MSALHKVLVVDDDPVVGSSFNRVLTRKGYEVITARNAHEALERLRKDEYDLVYTDIKMPGMNGLELAEKVKERRPWTPVVIVTGYGTESDERRAMQAGVSAFLHKPLSPEMIEGSAIEALHVSEHVIAMPALPAAPAVVAEPAAEPVAEKAGFARTAGNIALFFAAPFIGLAYAVFMPFVGIGMAVWLGGKEFVKRGGPAKLGKALKFIGMGIGGALIGLAYAVLLPVVGVGALAWIGLKAFAETATGRKVVPTLKFAAIAVAAPFIGLAYIIALPLAGLATLAWIAGRALTTKG